MVVSHHGPHRLSIHPRYAGEATNAAFAPDLSDAFPGVNLWIHGHVHESYDFTVGGCRVVANPLGYPRNRDNVEDVSGLLFENAGFKWSCVVDV